MIDAEKTIGNLIDKQGVAFISSVDVDGFPNTKAMLPPRKREGIKRIYFLRTPRLCGCPSTGRIRKRASTSATGVFSGA